MAIQRSDAVRNAMLDAIGTAIGTSPRIDIRSGVPPVSTSAPDRGALLARFALGVDWIAAASSGSASLASLPISTEALASGIAGHYRITNAAGTTVHMQGTASSAAGADLVLSNSNIVTGMTVRIVTWSITDSNG